MEDKKKSCDASVPLEDEKSDEDAINKKRQHKRMAELGYAQAYLMHEMRRPLITLGLLARSLRRRGTLEEKDYEILDSIIELVTSTETMLNDSLDFVGPPKGKRKPVDVVKLLKGVRRALLPQAKSNGVAIKLESPAGDPPTVACVRRRLRHAVLNAAQNSIEAMAGNGGSMSLACRETDDKVIMTIKDTGPGMEAEVRKNMFRPFFSDKRGGSGLGLALAKKIIQDHNGKIIVRSNPQQGTSLTMQLPKEERKL